MIYATDLDRTLIFSNKFIEKASPHLCVCVDESKGRPVSYMTQEAFLHLNILKKKLGLFVIPATTRSIRQYRQVSVVQSCKYAVTTNGGIILCDGERLKEWDEIVAFKLREYTEEFIKVKELVNKISNFFERDLAFVDDIFFYTVLKPEFLIDVDNYLRVSLNSDLWSYTIQGAKLYVIPEGITKENALLFLKKYLNQDYMITSGDGKLDKGLLKCGNLALIPLESEVLEYIKVGEFKYQVVPAGLLGTNYILDIVEAKFNSYRK